MSGSPAGSMSATAVSLTGLGNPGSSTGGVIREASGTASVSAATPGPAGDPGSTRAGDIPGRDHQREPEGDLAVLVGQRLAEAQPDGNPLPGNDVAHAHGENVRAFLLRDRRAAAFPDGGVVRGAGLGPFLQDRLDDTAAGLHPQSSDRGPVRQREDIGRLERNVEGVAETLREFHPGEGPGDAGPDINAVQGQVSSRRDECAEAAVRLCLAVIWPCLLAAM